MLIAFFVNRPPLGMATDYSLTKYFRWKDTISPKPSFYHDSFLWSAQISHSCSQDIKKIKACSLPTKPPNFNWLKKKKEKKVFFHSLLYNVQTQETAWSGSYTVSPPTSSFQGMFRYILTWLITLSPQEI